MIVFFILRSILATVLFAVITVILSIFLVLEAIFFNYRPLEDKVVWFWSVSALKLFQVKVTAEGVQNIPEGSCLFLFNHTSFFDIFAMHAIYPHFRFGAKIELFSIPFFGQAMRKMGALPIARHDREKVFQVYAAAKERVAKGEKFALSPEGGRSFEPKLMPFKAGPFIFAIHSGMPLVPVVITGAQKVLGKGQWLANWKQAGGEIHVRYLDVISVSGLQDKDKKDLQKKVFSEMEKYI